MAASGLITLTTDFGLSDAYVGALKGALLSGNSAATLVDITHDVWPQAIEQGAFLLSLAAPHFPPGTVHLAVVDPGVSTERRALAIQTASAFFVGPDNGVLSCALGEWPQAGEVSLPEGVAAVELSN
ncbi:MAG TPA: SAM-dependent chlorinase/fluorinase, partial [Dehalococcoidia bacterium]|nr:SAM-dependent chlorinase/fluorinase [Dehalococcoidia bacterium]